MAWMVLARTPGPRRPAPRSRAAGRAAGSASPVQATDQALRQGAGLGARLLWAQVFEERPALVELAVDRPVGDLEDEGRLPLAALVTPHGRPSLVEVGHDRARGGVRGRGAGGRSRWRARNFGAGPAEEPDAEGSEHGESQQTGPAG